MINLFIYDILIGIAEAGPISPALSMPGNYTKEAYLLFILIYLCSAIVISLEGRRRAIGGMKTFMLSVVFTPIIGFLFMLFSENRRRPKSRNWEQKQIKMFKCRNCGYSFEEDFNICPFCGTEKINKKQDNP